MSADVAPCICVFALDMQAVAAVAFVNLVAAEILTNLHSFLIVVPNHAGEDVYRFKTPVKVKTDDFYLRAVIGSANFRTGGDVNDFLHGWLNYQIEHHMFADMTMLSYQRMAPEVKAICDKHGVPYVQESVFERLRKTLQVRASTACTLRSRLVARRPVVPVGPCWQGGVCCRVPICADKCDDWLACKYLEYCVLATKAGI